MDLLPIILIVVVLVVGVGAIIFIRRRQAASGDVPLPDIGEPMDYTTPEEDEEESPGLRERFDSLPMPAKIGILAAPLVLIGLIVIVIVVSQITGGPSEPKPAQQPQQQEEPTPLPPPTIEMSNADLVNANSIRVAASTNLPDGTDVYISMLEDGNQIPWFVPEESTVKVTDGKVDVRVNKAADAPSGKNGLTYTVLITGTSTDGQVAEFSQDLDIPENFRGSFFENSPEPEPVEVPAIDEQPPEEQPPEEQPPEEQPPEEQPPEEQPPEEQPPEEQPPEEQPPEEQPPEEQPPEERPIPTGEMTASVANGGNVRASPGGEPVLDQVNALENVLLIKKTPDMMWYFMRNERDVEGWVHTSLLNISPEVDARVPVEGAADQPVEDQPVEDQPVEEQPPEDQPAEDQPAEEQPSESTDMMVEVFNGGNVRAVPGGEPIVDQINAFEQVELLKKDVDGVWYFIRDERDIEGWVHYTLLNESELNQLAPEVPVEP